MSRIVTVAATQMAGSWDRTANMAAAESLVRRASAEGAQIVLLPELFETPYFCQKPNPDYTQLATTVEENAGIARLQKVAAELRVVLPISFFERADELGEKVKELNRTEQGIVVHSFDLDELETARTAWGVFRDRRPNLYWPIATLDGKTRSE